MIEILIPRIGFGINCCKKLEFLFWSKLLELTEFNYLLWLYLLNFIKCGDLNLTICYGLFELTRM